MKAVKTTSEINSELLSVNKLLLLSAAEAAKVIVVIVDVRYPVTPPPVPIEREGGYKIQTSEPKWRQSGCFPAVFTDFFASYSAAHRFCRRVLSLYFSQPGSFFYPKNYYLFIDK